MEQGYFEQYGLDVEVQIAQNAAAVAPSVLNGQLQFGFAAASPFIGAVSRGLPLYAVANSSSNSVDGSDETGLVAVADSPLERPRDLVGKTVAVNGLSALPHVAAMEAIERDGGDPDTVTFVAMPFPDMIGALRQGRIDAAALAEPFYSRSLDAGYQQLSTLYATAFEPGSTTTLYFTAGPFIETNPEVVENFTNAIELAIADAARDDQLVRDVLVEYGNMDPQAAQTMGLPHYSTELTPHGLEQISDVMAKFDIITEPIEGSEVIYP
ncbi:ABC transporter substrate-binding protein [Citricoccus sp. NR2]|uniref:ABC transporter substrate-binding protein n=1 Tax=Citricoccus sp. NR2 TaxID=3004095 RepID=UPI0022DD873B|nr:ABC transporter substrate-binding protein [Citricoccus sp. NR2]WBL19751.1 ABC transporter substrate-binding protein [Citricoccus sp. NR2]